MLCFKLIHKVILIKQITTNQLTKNLPWMTKATTCERINIQGGPIKTVHFLRYHIFAPLQI